MQGRYKVKSADLKPLYERASKIVRQIAYFTIEHVRREQNKDADALANVALDSGPVMSTAASSAGDGKIGANDRGERRRVQKIRARFANGVLVPSEPLDLPEGSEVILDLHGPMRE
jgi:hypothetical protein